MPAGNTTINLEVYPCRNWTSNAFFGRASGRIASRRLPDAVVRRREKFACGMAARPMFRASKPGSMPPVPSRENLELVED
jgi:hypothetical protein